MVTKKDYELHLAAFELAVKHKNAEAAEFHLRQMKNHLDDLITISAERGIVAFEEFLRGDVSDEE